MRITRDFFVDSASSTTVQLKRVPNSSLDNTCAGVQIHSAALTIGRGSATTVEAGAGAFWQTGCIRYRVTVEKLS